MTHPWSRTGARLLLAAGAVLWLASCAVDDADPDVRASEDPGSPVTSTRASPSTEAAPDAGPTTYGPATFVSGQVSCAILFGTTTVNELGTMQSRDGSLTCAYQLDDPRVTGQSTETWMSDRWSGEHGGGILIQWGSASLVTDRGAWEGTYSGSYDGDVDTISYWFQGSGPYEGLTFHMWFLDEPAPDDNKRPTWLVEGIIYPGDPPPSR